MTRTIAVGVFAMALPITIRAQAVRGHVVDERGAPVAHAEVQVMPSGARVFTTAAGAFDLWRLDSGTHTLRLRRVGFEVTTVQIIVPNPDTRLTIAMKHLAAVLDTVHATSIEARLPRMFNRLQQHLGVELYGPALDSVFAKGGSRPLADMLTIDRRAAMIMERPHCGGRSAIVVDGIPVDTLATMAPKGMEDFTLNIEQYISQPEISAIELFDSPDFVHEPWIDGHFEATKANDTRCKRIVLIWSKYYQQLPWAGH